jgi:hypothetical protein
MNIQQALFSRDTAVLVIDGISVWLGENPYQAIEGIAVLVEIDLGQEMPEGLGVAGDAGEGGSTWLETGSLNRVLVVLTRRWFDARPLDDFKFGLQPIPTDEEAMAELLDPPGLWTTPEYML